jgi:hypothetical protein
MNKVVLVSGDIFTDSRIETLIKVWPVSVSKFEMVGWLVFLWASVLDDEPSGIVAHGLMVELASGGLSGSLRGNPDVVRWMIDAGLLREIDSETVEIVGWEDWTGSIPLKRKKKAERMKRYRAKCRRLQEPDVDVYTAEATENKEEDEKARRRLREKCRRLQSGESGLTVSNQGVTEDGAESADFSGGNLIIDQELNYNKLINYNKNPTLNLIDSPKKKKKYQKKEKLRATMGDVESGSCDSWPKKDAAGHPDVLAAFASVHADVWGAKTSSKSKLIKTTVKQLIVSDGWSPSDVCKAIRGMSNDTWSERKKFNGWTYLAKHFEKWLSLHSQGSDKADAGSWGPWRDEGFSTREAWEEHKGKK